ncbi:MAG: hypothetical protein DRJ60_04445 [Thermoprotei archaeon]|nr:MAG: hypothetical protein DRJ60_04445 [Thermoprotei archaeon]
MLEWPYPIRYYTLNKVDVDVLVVGGGMAGCWAAIRAARRGVKVAIAEKASVIRSGAAGSGIDHWQHAATNPCSKVAPEELTEAEVEHCGGYTNGIVRYIRCRDAWDTLLEMERMGAKIRDTEDEFKGAPFRDDETKLLFAYDYENKFTLRVWGTTFKPALFNECRRLGVDIFNRVMITSLLLSNDGKEARIAGAIGVDQLTGELYVFRAKAVVLSTGVSTRLWSFIDPVGLSSFYPPNETGDGIAMAWKIGAMLTLMESSGPAAGIGIFSWPSFGIGNPANTWYPCRIVDSKGREVPFVDRDGRPLRTPDEVTKPSPGQKFMLIGGSIYSGRGSHKYLGPRITPNLSELVEKGELTPPFYADLPSMPEHERKAIFGLMVGQEGKTNIPIYYNYTRAGFDPDKDMLQAYWQYGSETKWLDWFGKVPANFRDSAVGSGSKGGLVVDWNLKTNIEGLYAAGCIIAGSAAASCAATSGRWAGAKAADYAKSASAPSINWSEVDEEEKRIYSLIEREEGICWKELNAGICRVMREYCGDYKNEDLLNIGLIWIKEIKEKEAKELYARNPHELIRALEVLNILVIAEIVLHASLARRASSEYLGFYRLDYPQLDPPEWRKFITIRNEGGTVKIGELPFNYWLKPPFKSSYQENYEVYKPW